MSVQIKPHSPDEAEVVIEVTLSAGAEIVFESRDARDAVIQRVVQVAKGFLAGLPAELEHVRSRANSRSTALTIEIVAFASSGRVQSLQTRDAERALHEMLHEEFGRNSSIVVFVDHLPGSEPRVQIETNPEYEANRGRHAPPRPGASDDINVWQPGDSNAVAPVIAIRPGRMAKATATAFAPTKFRAGTSELVQIVAHPPEDIELAIRMASRADKRTRLSAQRDFGEVPFGNSIGVALEVSGANCDGAIQRQVWEGHPLVFPFTVNSDPEARQVIVKGRLFVEDAEIGTVVFARPTGSSFQGPQQAKPLKFKRYRRVFLSYSSQDRDAVANIATAYACAGVAHFWDRTSLTSGEEWSTRIRREIDACDLFHLCWSSAAAASDWVEKETCHAIAKRRRSLGRRPNITVQMLDGPPWAKHRPSLNSLNFDDFTRAAIVGYASAKPLPSRPLDTSRLLTVDAHALSALLATSDAGATPSERLSYWRDELRHAASDDARIRITNIIDILLGLQNRAEKTT